MAMPCQRCQKKPATVHLTDINPGGEKRERHYCESCAEAEGVTMTPHESVHAILQEFVKQKAGAGVMAAANLKCPRCGITFREFRNEGHLGCPDDYDVFAEYLGPLIKRAHEGSAHHTGKVPKEAGPAAQRQSLRNQLQHQLREAVEQEDYERAAELRDRLQSHDDEH